MEEEESFKMKYIKLIEKQKDYQRNYRNTHKE